MPLEYVIPSLRVTAFTNITDPDAVQERLAALIEHDEDRFLAGFHQHVHKSIEKAWHDRHIKNTQFQKDDLVLLYNNKFMKFPGKFHQHWLGPYQVLFVTNRGEVELKKLDGTMVAGHVNGSRLKLYRATEPIFPDP